MFGWIVLWDEYVMKNNVIIPDRHLFETLEDILPVRVPVNEGWPPMNFKKPFVPPKELVEEKGGGRATRATNSPTIGKGTK